MNRLKAILRNQRGMSIIEVLVASLLTVLVVWAALEFYLSSHKSWMMQNDVSEVQQNARVCLDEMAGNLRMAGYDLPAGHPAFQAGNDSLTVYFRRNGKVDTISYYIHIPDTTQAFLIRHVVGEYPAVFADGVEGITVTQVAARIFELALTARGEQTDREMFPGDGHRRRTLTTEVMVRNLSI
jgi:Tfp pilus assembly protein PilV